ncbi:MAG: 4'-phosphopantetheinyl transferase family protein [Oscillospiraceae bacterium]
MQRICTFTGAGSKQMLRLYALPLDEDIPKRRQNRLSHLAAVDLLSAALAADWHLPHCRMLRDEQGKPYLADVPLFVNISHCRGLAICAVATLPVGVDCESPRVVKETTVTRICSGAEQAFLAASVHKPYDFSRLWTLKEAYGKCIGAGIRLPLAEIAFTIHGDTIAFCHPQGDAYAFLQLLLPDAHIAAICIPKSNAVQQIQYHLPQLRVCESQYLPKGAFCHVTD